MCECVCVPVFMQYICVCVCVSHRYREITMGMKRLNKSFKKVQHEVRSPERKKIIRIKSKIVRKKHRGLCLSYPLLVGVSHFNPMTFSPLKPPFSPPSPPPPPQPSLLRPHPAPFIPPSRHPSALRSIPLQTLLSAEGTKHGWIMAVKCHRFFMAAASSPRSPPGLSPRLTINQPAAPEPGIMNRNWEGGREEGKQK